MTVILSPWSICDTSIPADKGRKLGQSPAIAASFLSQKQVPTSKKARYRSMRQDDVIPSLVLTSKHQINVLGKSLSGVDSGDLFVESDAFQYYGRPTKVAAFLLDESSPPLKTSADCRSIGARIDLKLRKVYALQSGNQRLLCWPMNGGVDESSSAKLEAAAFDLSVLEMSDNTFVYGSLRNHSLFIAQCSDGDLRVEHARPSSLPSDATLIGTVAVRTEKNEEIAGAKRKMSADEVVLLYQFFTSRHQIIIVRHEFEGLSSGIASCTRKSVQNVAIDFIPPDRQGTEEVGGASVLGLLKNEFAVVVVYSAEKTTNATSPILFGASISLETGRISHGPLELSSEAKQVALLGPSVLAVGIKRSILFYDIQFGALFQEVAIDEISEDIDEDDWTFVTDENSNRIAVLYTESGGTKVAFSQLESEQPTKPLTLAECLEAAVSMDASTKSILNGNFLVDIATVDGSSCKASLDILRDAFRCIQAKTADSTSSTFLINAFEEASKIFHHSKSGNAEKTQDSEKRNGSPKIKNGIHDHGSSINGFVESHTTLTNNRSSPFVDLAIDVAVETLLINDLPRVSRAKYDAATIIKRLRANSFSLLRSLRWDQKLLQFLLALDQFGNKYKSMDFIADIVRCGGCASERQRVAFLHYILKYGQARRLAKCFLRSKAFGSDSTLKELSQRYVFLNSKENLSSSTDGELSGLSHRLTNAAITWVFEKTIMNSECNQSLLRDAFISVTSQEEVQFLLRIASQVLRLQGLRSFSKDRANNSSVHTFDWLKALVDASFFVKRKETDRLLALVRREIKITESCIDLQTLLSNYAFLASEKESRDSTPSVKAVTMTDNNGQLPPYQLERLVF